ncbi:MAG: carbohydrate binding domain-containing protein, partial [Lachnospiraceae bacterium]|nr:carbohydrate binding domain-containing protein [Lachnospiraceae bacterium]
NKIVFTFSEPGVFYLDDVRVVEDSLIKNGSFNAGFAGYEVYAYNASDVEYVVDSLSEDNAADFSITNTGDEAWKIQLKQNNIELENGQWYRISLNAKSSIARKIMFAIQRDGTDDDDWTPYSGESIVELGSDYQTYEIEFLMEAETDLKSVLSISMGAVDGTQINEKHRVCIDNINLEKIEK